MALILNKDKTVIYSEYPLCSTGSFTYRNVLDVKTARRAPFIISTGHHLTGFEHNSSGRFLCLLEGLYVAVWNLKSSGKPSLI